VAQPLQGPLCGHYAAQSLFHTLAARYFWKTMFADATEYC